MSSNVTASRYMLRGVSAITPTREEIQMNKLLSALILGAFALVQVPAYAQAAAPAAAPAAPAASAAKKDDKKAAEKTAEKKAPKKEKKGGC